MTKEKVVMPHKTCPRQVTTRTPDTSDAVQAVSAPVTTSPPTQVVCTRTTAEDKLWKALRSHPDSTATELSVAAGIGKSTAAKILAVWAADSSVRRSGSITHGTRRAADRWTIIDTDPDIDTTTDSAVTKALIDPPTSTEATHGDEHRRISHNTHEIAVDDKAETTTEARAQDDTADSAAQTAPQQPPRLTPGALRTMVDDFLNDHRGEEFSPSKIATALGRSSGAVHNALETLAKTGYAVKTQHAPKRFTATPHQEPTLTATH